MKLEDLVVLKFAPNNCFVEVVDVSQIKEKDFKIDLEKKHGRIRDGTIIR